MVEWYVIGFVYATVVGHIFIKPIVSSMWDFLSTKHKGLSEGNGRYSSQPAILGVVERSLYYASLLFAFPAFIGVWLTLKTVAKSPRWTNEATTRRQKGNPPGRAVFQPFLVGNGLSILYGGAGFLITLLGTKLDYLSDDLLYVAAIGPIAFSIIVYLLFLIPLKLGRRKRKQRIINQINPLKLNA